VCDYRNDGNVVEYDISSLDTNNLVHVFDDFDCPTVKRLGIELKVPLHKIELIINQHANQAEQAKLSAIDVVEFWKDNTSLDENEKLTHFANALNECHHKRAAQKLIYRRRAKTRQDLSEDEVYNNLKKLITDDKEARKFGHSLGLPAAIVGEIMRTDDFSDVKALSMFIKWKANCALEDDAMIERLNNAIIDITSSLSPVTETAINVQQQDENIPLLRSPQQASSLPSNKRIKPKLFSICKAISAVTLSLLLIIEIIMIILIFAYSPYYTTVILTGDTISLPLPDYTPYELELKLYGDKASCEMTIINLPCSEEPTVTTITQELNINYQYLAQGSSIIIDPADIPDEDKPYNIWLFDDMATANMAVADRFKLHHGYNCEDPHQACIKVYSDDTTPIFFNITKSSYYFMRCERGTYNCSQLSKWTIFDVSYNFTEADNLASSIKIKIHAENKTVHIHLREIFFPSPSSISTCILAKLTSPESCGSRGNTYFINVSFVQVFIEWTLYNAIVIAVLIVINCIVFKACRSK
jgi:hypothetical protein